ncbi:MAG: hypothetical protein ACKOW1_06175 [Novosphingobium sp.]|jgi:PBP1b-binding outer membrane lipoprotein LpoB
MRTIVILALMLSACSREPSFDERYAATEQRLQAKTKALDRAAAGVPSAANPQVTASGQAR